METTIASLASIIPSDVELISMLKFIAIIAFASVFIGLIGRVAFGTRSGLNHALSSAMGILFIYALTIVIYSFNPQNLAQYLAPLPFVTFSGSTLYIFSFLTADFPAICSQVLSMVILAFLVNLLDTFIPKGKKIIHWYLLRFLTVILAIILHGIVTWLINTYLPDTLVLYAPVVLLVILLALFLLGAAKVILGVVLTVANPVIGAIYTFFFSNIIGKQLSKAVLTAVVLCAVVYLLEYFGYAAISIATAALAAYIPLILVLLILWYLIGHVL